ncbi:MAG: hypothetical protein IAI49_00090 [Candidatus Eremiobacteraeota bacterium]|nr:hypothetical protein [Candidatus Eremiobacteraeota bacterium]
MERPSPEPELRMLPEVEARGLLGGRRLSFRLWRPPSAASGLGVLRLLRVAESDGRTEIVAGYDGYERIDARERQGSKR